MKERPITFSGSLPRKVLRLEKTQTRRIINGNIARDLEDGWGSEEQHIETRDGDVVPASSLCPLGRPGDKLWVRETYYQFGHWEEVDGAFTPTGREKWMFVPDKNMFSPSILFDAPQIYRKGINREDRAPCEHPRKDWYKRLARFMPRKLSRITLQIESVRCERLLDISEEDALAEGIAYQSTDGFGQKWYGISDKVESDKDGNMISGRTPVEAFFNLWDSVHGCPGAHKDNPWVWVIKFKPL